MKTLTLEEFHEHLGESDAIATCILSARRVNMEARRQHPGVTGGDSAFRVDPDRRLARQQRMTLNASARRASAF